MCYNKVIIKNIRTKLIIYKYDIILFEYYMNICSSKQVVNVQ